MRKVVVLGSTGMAGHVVSMYLQEKGYDVFKTSRSEKNGPKSASIDVTDFDSLFNWLDWVDADVIVNCIGILQQTCENRPDLAVLINSYLPHCLEEKYKNKECKIIHLSTDCVFSGQNGPYNEDDVPNGRTMYDRSKALGELNNNKDLTFRMSIIGPDIDSDGIGLFNWFMNQDGEVNGWSKAIWNGITTIELSRAIHEAIKQELTGIYQLVPDESIDKYSLLMLIKKIFQRENVIVHKIDGLQVDKTLINSRRDFDFIVRPYEQQIQDMLCWIKEHSDLYTYYG